MTLQSGGCDCLAAMNTVRTLSARIVLLSCAASKTWWCLQLVSTCNFDPRRSAGGAPARMFQSCSLRAADAEDVADVRWHHQTQDDFVPGLTKAGLARQLQEVHGASGSREFRGRDMSGWYLQQVRGCLSPPGSSCPAADPTHVLRACVLARACDCAKHSSPVTCTVCLPICVQPWVCYINVRVLHVSSGHDRAPFNAVSEAGHSGGATGTLRALPDLGPGHGAAEPAAPPVAAAPWGTPRSAAAGDRSLHGASWSK